MLEQLMENCHFNCLCYAKNVAPPFSIYTKKGLRIDVPGIPVSELEEAQSKVNETCNAKKLGKRENEVDYVIDTINSYEG